MPNVTSRASAVLLGLLLGLLAVAPARAARPGPPPAVKTRVVELGPLKIEGISHSMEGVFQRAMLDTGDIGWITGFRTEVVDSTTGLPLGDEYFCHSQIQLATGARLMVAASGIPALRLPSGFGIPLQQILGDLEEPWRGVSLLGMVLNNHDADLSAEVNVRFLVDYVAAGEPAAADNIDKLYRASVTVLPHRGVTVLAGDPMGPSELPPNAHGKTGHWMVPPGKQVIRQQHTRLVPGPTRVHYGVVHMHNYGSSLKLTDVTDGRVLWETRVEYNPDVEYAQIARIPVYSSESGFVMHPDHTYEIESVYDNRTDVPVDAMAVMYLYHHPLGDQNMTYPPAPGATPPTDMDSPAGHHQ